MTKKSGHVSRSDGGAVVVTGAGGYLGNVLVHRLLAENRPVVALDRFFFGDLLPEHPLLRRLVLDTRLIQPATLEGAQAVIDLAAVSNDATGDHFAQQTIEINHRARVTTARAARQAGVPRYILPSSCSVYGIAEGVVDEESPLRPLTTYAKANLAAEEGILGLEHEHFTPVALRLATLYGWSARLRLDLVANNMSWRAVRGEDLEVFGSGEQLRPLLHVEDAAEAIVRALDAREKDVRGQVLNVGDANVSIRELAAIVADVSGSALGRTISVRYRSVADERSYAVNFERIAGLLGFRPRIPLRAGLAGLMEKFRGTAFRADSRNFTLDWYRALEAQGRGLRTLNDETASA